MSGMAAHVDRNTHPFGNRMELRWGLELGAGRDGGFRAAHAAARKAASYREPCASIAMSTFNRRSATPRNARP